MSDFICRFFSSSLQIVVVSFTTLLVIVSAQAQPIYEGFNYTPASQLAGTVAGGGDGGFGFATTWSATSAAVSTNTSVGLSYGSLPTTGGGVVFGNPNGSTGPTASSERLLPNTLTGLLGGSGSIWMSVLYQNLTTDHGSLAGYREAKLAFFSGATAAANGTANVNGTERVDVGSPNTYAVGASDNLSLFNGSTFVSSGIATPRGSGSANTVFILLRFDVDATTATDTVWAWFNPSLASEPTTSSAISYTASDLTSVNALRFQAGNLNASGTNAVFEADELRVGFTFGDVTTAPEPSVMVFSLLGGILLIGWRRVSRKQP